MIPALDLRLRRPSKASLAFYAGLGAVAALEVVEWPLALVIAAGHAVATNTGSPEVEQAAEGIQAGV